MSNGTGAFQQRDVFFLKTNIFFQLFSADSYKNNSMHSVIWIQLSTLYLQYDSDLYGFFQKRKHEQIWNVFLSSFIKFDLEYVCTLTWIDWEQILSVKEKVLPWTEQIVLTTSYFIMQVSVCMILFLFYVLQPFRTWAAMALQNFTSFVALNSSPPLIILVLPSFYTNLLGSSIVVFSPVHLVFNISFKFSKPDTFHYVPLKFELTFSDSKYKYPFCSHFP